MVTTHPEIEKLSSPATESEASDHPINGEWGSLNPSTPARPLEDGIVDMGPAFEESTLLGTMNDARLRVRQPFQVTMATENDDFIAEAEEIDEFGFGKNPSAAVRDLQLTIVELYFTLKNEAHRLGPDLKRVFSVLESKLDLTHDD